MLAGLIFLVSLAMEESLVAAFNPEGEGALPDVLCDFCCPGGGAREFP
jgi:hypothetical protein